MPGADLIVRAAAVRTLDPARPVVEAVALAGGRIIATGSAAEMLALRTAGTELIDLGLSVLTPGLVDGHTHPVMGSDITVGADLTACVDLAGLTERLTAEAARTPPGEWVRGWGLDQTALSGLPVTSALIDGAITGRPTVITLADVHAALVSTTGLAMAGITGPREFSSNSVVVCDDTGTPTGYLVEWEAVDLVRRVLPPPPAAERLERLRLVLDAMAATGLTGGHVMDGEGLELIEMLDTAKALPLRLRIAPWCRPGQDDGQRLLDLQRLGGRNWQVAGVKLFLDGTIDLGTAWLHRPDSLSMSTKPYWRDPAAYRRAVQFFDAAGVPTATHAIGDAAVEYVLDTLAGLPADGVRHRIEHLETMPDELVARCAVVDPVASIQPTHATDFLHADHSDNWSRRVGRERADNGFRCRDLIEAGVTVALGSDWPVSHFDPRRVMAAAQLRRPPGTAAPAVQPGQALTAAQALAGYTTGPAAARGDTQDGRLMVGRYGDLTAFAADPLILPPDELADVPVALTVVDGLVRYRGTAAG